MNQDMDTYIVNNADVVGEATNDNGSIEIYKAILGAVLICTLGFVIYSNLRDRENELEPDSELFRLQDVADK